MNPTDTIIALEKALEACEQTQGADKPYELYMDFRAELAKAAHPDALRTLLDAHASALRDAERYRWLREQIQSGPLTIAKSDSWSLQPWSGDDPDARIDAARAALVDNTKGAAE